MERTGIQLDFELCRKIMFRVEEVMAQEGTKGPDKYAFEGYSNELVGSNIRMLFDRGMITAKERAEFSLRSDILRYWPTNLTEKGARFIEDFRNEGTLPRSRTESKSGQRRRNPESSGETHCRSQERAYGRLIGSWEYGGIGELRAGWWIESVWYEPTPSTRANLQVRCCIDLRSRAYIVSGLEESSLSFFLESLLANHFANTLRASQINRANRSSQSNSIAASYEYYIGSARSHHSQK